MASDVRQTRAGGRAAVRLGVQDGMPKLPVEWEYAALSDLALPERSITYGIVQPGKHQADGIPIVRVNDIRSGRINPSAPLRVAPAIVAKYRRTELQGGELLLTLVGTVGESAIVPDDMAGWNVARAVAVVPIIEDVGARWVQICLRMRELQHLIRTWCTTTVQATFNLRDVARLPIPIPPKNVRHAIVQILGSLDDKIELNRRTNRTLEQMAAAIFKAWFVDFEPVKAKADGAKSFPSMPQKVFDALPTEFTDSPLGPIPKGWAVGALLEHADLLSGGTPKTSEPQYWSGNILWASAKDVSQCGKPFLTKTERTITVTGVEESATQIIDPFATVVVARGATTGRLCMFGEPIAMNQTCYALQSRSANDLFLYCLVRASIGSLVHAAHGSVFDTITTRTFQTSKVIIPPVETSNAFEDRVRSFFHLILTLQRQSETLIAMRDALLPKLLAGEIRVGEAERIVGDVA